MIEGVTLALIGLGALLVSIGSMLRLAWLAVLIPMLIAGGAAVGLFLLSRRGPRRVTGAANRKTRVKNVDDRMAA